MNVNPLSRVDPINEDPSDERRRKRQSLYSCEEVLKKASISVCDRLDLDEPSFSKPLESIRLWAKQTEKFLSSLLTIEEKIGQLILFELDADYDFEQFQNLKQMVLESQIGGILFNEGNLRRECYLIEHMQSLASIPLLMGHSLNQGFSYLFSSVEQDFNFWDLKDVQYFEDLGKMIMIQNKRLGVHFQCIQTPGKNPLFSRIKQRAFCRGLRAIRGLSASFDEQKEPETSSLFQNPSQFTIQSKAQALAYKKELNFISIDTKTEAQLRNVLLGSSFDMIYTKQHPEDLIHTILKMVKNQEIDEKAIDKKLKNLLLIKSVFFTE